MIDTASSESIMTLKRLVFKYSKGKKVKPKGKIPLSWLNDNLWKLTRTRDSALKKSHKTGLTTDRLIYKELRNKVTQQRRQAKAMLYLNIIKRAKGNS